MGIVNFLMWLWAAWCVFHVIVWLASPWLLRDDCTAFTNGLVVVVPQGVKDRLNPDELAAIYAHEDGHIHRGHPFKNLLRACLFMGRLQETVISQEYEADDYAAARGHACALASAISKLSQEPVELYRVRRLLARA